MTKHFHICLILCSLLPAQFMIYMADKHLKSQLFLQ